MFALGLFAGAVAGCAIGVLVTALCVVSGRKG